MQISRWAKLVLFCKSLVTMGFFGLVWFFIFYFLRLYVISVYYLLSYISPSWDGKCTRGWALFWMCFGNDKYMTGTDLQYLSTDSPKSYCANLNPGLTSPQACNFLSYLGFPFLIYKKTLIRDTQCKALCTVPGT